jgi:ATP-binding cassette subfamily B protein
MDPADGKMHQKLLTDFEKEWTGVLVLLLPDEEFETGNEKVSVFRRFWFLLRPHKWVLLQALFGAVIYTILGLSTAVYIQKITDNVITGGNQNLLNLMSVGMIVLLLMQLFIGTVKSIFAFKTGQQMDAQLILGYYKHLLKLPQQFFDTMRVGEIISRVNDAVKIRLFINEVALGLLVNVFIIIFSFALMFTYYWKLALVMLIVIPLYVLTYFIANQINKRLQRKLMEDAADLETQLVESLNSIATIKRFGLEEYANLKTENRFIQLLRTIYSAGMSGLYIGTASDFVSRLFTIVILWVGTYFVLQNELTPGELLSFYSLIGYFTSPAMSLIGANKSIQDAFIAADRLFEIMDLEQESKENKTALTPDLVGNIEFKQVSFKYGSRAKVFDELDLKIEKGKITAIVGESGSGKSTLLSLLQNLYPISSGNIFIGNLDIQYITNESLRKVVSVVPQQIDLFAGTLIENIAIGHFEPDMQRILGISQALGITEFVKTMPQGFSTMLGERGANLSGGQRQRIAIARALYQNPEILILDEATSSLDSISEKYVQDTLQLLREQQKTIIIIAHRLSTIRNADKIIALSEGKLIEEGTHEELLENKQAYYQLWNQQYQPVDV